MNGVELIAKERQRQIEELGYNYENDSLYANNQLAEAAATYALVPIINDVMTSKENGIPYLWPWDAKYYKPTPDDRIRELVKAGALIAAQIDYEINK